MNIIVHDANVLLNEQNRHGRGALPPMGSNKFWRLLMAHRMDLRAPFCVMLIGVLSPNDVQFADALAHPRRPPQARERIVEPG